MVVLTCSLLIAVCAPVIADETDIDIEEEFIACPSPALPFPAQKAT